MTQLKTKSLSQSRPATLNLRVFSHNIRYASERPSANERPWPDRLPLILNQFAYHTRFLQTCPGPQCINDSDTDIATSFICLQEVLHSQLTDILNGLNQQFPAKPVAEPSDVVSEPVWSHIGVGRDDGKQAGEYSPIIFPRQLFDVLHHETVWLSSTPDRPSKDWGAACIRIVNVGVFEQKQTQRRVMVCNTHLDHRSAMARENGVKLILKTICRVCEEWSQGGKEVSDVNSGASNYLPVILAGDFNAFDTDKAYLTMANSDFMTDVRDLVKGRLRYGDEKTFTSWGPDQEPSEQGRIDFLWLGDKTKIMSDFQQIEKHQEEDAGHQPELRIKVRGYTVLPNVWDKGVYCSDHRCVVADMEFLYP